MRSQVSLEFVMMFLLGVIIFSVAAVVISRTSTTIIERQADDDIRDFAHALQEIVFVAYDMQPGFTKEIVLPERIGESDYELEILDDNRYVRQNGRESIVVLPPTNGSFARPNTLLSRHDGKVELS